MLFFVRSLVTKTSHLSAKVPVFHSSVLCNRQFSAGVIKMCDTSNELLQNCCVHHVEFGVRNGEEFVRKFVNHYNFTLSATRSTENIKQWLLKSGTANILLTQQLEEITSFSKDKYFVGWTDELEKCSSKTKSPSVDSVFNVALKVKNVKRVVDHLSRSKVTILRPMQTIRDKCGKVELAVVQSCVGNVVHTLIDDSQYTGTFLPDFIPSNNDVTVSNECLVTHFDHVTFACKCGESGLILDWYSKCFGMKRFLINRDEDEEDGFVIDSEDVGLRLKAFEYWKCAETGLTSGQHPNSIKFVVAEALPDQGPNQVATFLQDHGGSGIQHIGLHTDDIIHTVDQLKTNGVEFAEPPYTYYTEVGKLAEMHAIGQNVDLLRENGILVDAEADPGELEDSSQMSSAANNNRYLMQKFTKPLFDRNTFFLEVIQRVGARGFGSGNITALWRSVQAYMNSKNKEAP